jgi:hypothetical protein
MTRTAIGGIAAGSFTLGILAGLLLPGTLDTSRHDQLMAAHMSAMGSMPMDIGSMNGGSMPMDMGSMNGGSMPMGPRASTPGHEMHHASPEVGQ